MFIWYNNCGCRYRGEILEVIDNITAKVRLIDVGNFSVDRHVKEIFHMPSKYKGKSLVSNKRYLYNLISKHFILI